MKNITLYLNFGGNVFPGERVFKVFDSNLRYAKFSRLVKASCLIVSIPHSLKSRLVRSFNPVKESPDTSRIPRLPFKDKRIRYLQPTIAVVGMRDRPL